jgi:acyl carrier protein
MSERIVSVLVKHAKKTGNPSFDEDLFDSGYLDSFALADFVGGLEAEFGIKVPDRDLTPRKFSSVEAIAGYLEGGI